MQFRVAPRFAAGLSLAAGLLVISGATLPVYAQSAWDARLNISAFPPPYLSDWESNPSIGTLTISNPTAADHDVLLTYRVTNHRGQVLASGRSERQLILAGAPTVLSDFVDMSGTSQHDQALEDQMRRTGRLPEGDNTACVAVTDPGGFVLAEDCVTFSIVYPDPPYLIGPMNDEALASGHPIFQWTPLQVPPAFHLTYLLRVSEVLAGQAPSQAIAANIPLFETTTFGTNLEYPIGAPPLEEGKTYAWWVQALDQNGYTASANEGRSEIWTFRLGDPAGGGTPAGGVGLYTLELAGDDDQSQPDSTGFFSICRNWSATDATNPNSIIKLRPGATRFFPKMNLRAHLHRYNVPGSNSRVWALVGTSGSKMLMAYGDCDGATDVAPWPRWLGIRSLDGAASTAFLMFGDTTHTDTTYQSSEAGLEFGTVIFAATEVTAAAPPGFEVVRAFLEDHEIDLKPGVNAFGILQLKERPFWAFFEWLGYDEKEITLQGFAGVNTSLSAGFGASSEGGAQMDKSAELELLNLRAALPTRTPPLSLRHLFKGMRWEMELVVQDTMQATRSVKEGQSTGHQIDLLLNLNHVLELSDGAVRALRLNPGAEIVSTTGLDVGKEWEKGEGQPLELQVIRKYTLDGTWPLGGGFVVGQPEAEFDVVVYGEDKGNWSFAISGAIGWGEQEELGKLGLTIGNKEAEGLFAGSYKIFRERDEKRVLEFKGRQAQLARDGMATEADRQHVAEELATAERALAKTIADAEAAAKIKTPSSAGRGREWTWVVRASLGNMSLVDFFSLMRSVAAEAAGS